MADNQPQRGILQGFSEWLQQVLAAPRNTFLGSGRLSLTPYGNYSGGFTTNVRNVDVIRNPYGVASRLTSDIDSAVNFSALLQPGQSVEVSSGRLSDPKLNATTAKRLNEDLQQRRVQEAGLQQAAQTSARESRSVLATLDEMFLGNTATKVETGQKRTGFSLAKEIGFNEGRQKTILGEAASQKKVVKPPRSI
jgi:predicted S18 family serine protease